MAGGGSPKNYIISNGGYVNHISAYQLADQDGGYQKHNLIVKSGGTALNVVRTWFVPPFAESGYYAPTLNVTSETGAVVTYIDEN